jgi:hypothetical protein
MTGLRLRAKTPRFPPCRHAIDVLLAACSVLVVLVGSVRSSDTRDSVIILCWSRFTCAQVCVLCVCVCVSVDGSEEAGAEHGCTALLRGAKVPSHLAYLCCP